MDCVLFLDCDGVVNSDDFLATVPPDTTPKSFHWYKDNVTWFLTQVDPAALGRIHQVVAATGASVVVTSTWRQVLSIADLSAVLKMPIHDVTVDRVFGQKMSEYPPRGAFIQQWLKDSNYTGRFAIVDDDGSAATSRWPRDAKFDALAAPRFVRTVSKTGFLDDHVPALIAALQLDP